MVRVPLVLVDTSVWIQHFRAALPDVLTLAAAGAIASHPVVVGELAVGGLPNRTRTLTELRLLPRVRQCPADDALDFLERHRLYGLGLSWGDVQLLAAADLSGVPLWTLDKPLLKQAQALGLAWAP